MNKLRDAWNFEHTPLLLAIFLIALLYWAIINTTLPDMIVSGSL
jgi:hypothetical protein